METDLRLPVALLASLCAAAAIPPPAQAVFNGTPPAPGDAPWLAAFQTRGVTICGGALIAPDRVLTAAHCVRGVDPARLHLRIGGGDVRAAREVAWRGATLPPGYREIPSPVEPENPSRDATVDDLAVVRLRPPVTDVPVLGVLAGPAVPPEPTRTLGRGRTGPVAGGPRAPLAIDQVVLGAGACRVAYGALLDPARHLCTIDASGGGAQACAGDSGGPVLVQRDGRPLLAGVVTGGGETQGRDCGGGLPDVAESLAAKAGFLARLPSAVAPWAQRRVRVRRSGRVRRCVIGRWEPGRIAYTVRWYTRGADRRGPRRPRSHTTSSDTDLKREGRLPIPRT